MQPTSDIQFLAQICNRLFSGDQITGGELNRLRVLGDTGHSTIQDELRPPVEAGMPTLAPHATARDLQIAQSEGATRAGRF